MDNKQLSEILFHVSAQTLELFTMLFLVPEDEAPVCGACSMKSASVDFTGDFSGTLFISVEDAVLTEIASNMLGLPDEPPTAVQKSDSLKEIANVICGNFLPAVAGSLPVFHIGAPAITQEPASGVLSARLFTDKGTVTVSAAIHAQAAAR